MLPLIRYFSLGNYKIYYTHPMFFLLVYYQIISSSTLSLMHKKTKSPVPKETLPFQLLHIKYITFHYRVPAISLKICIFQFSYFVFPRRHHLNLMIRVLNTTSILLFLDLLHTQDIPVQIFFCFPLFIYPTSPKPIIA